MWSRIAVLRWQTYSYEQYKLSSIPDESCQTARNADFYSECWTKLYHTLKYCCWWRDQGKYDITMTSNHWNLTVCSTACSGLQQRKHQCCTWQALCVEKSTSDSLPLMLKKCISWLKYRKSVRYGIFCGWGWVSEWLNLMAFLGTTDIKVHVVHISCVITAYTLESLSSLT